jgi:cytochrome c-type biogenesis protein CcmH
MRGRWRPVSWVLMAVVLGVALYMGTAGGGAETPAQRASGLLSELRCPACADLSVTQSNAPSAVAIRQYVDQAVAKGQTDGTIESYLVSRYGPGVLLNPPTHGVSSLVWILPVVVVIAAAMGLVLAFRRRVPRAGSERAKFEGEAAWSARTLWRTRFGR